MVRKNIFEKRWLIVDCLPSGEFCLFRRDGLKDERHNGRKYSPRGVNSLIETIEDKIHLKEYEGKFRVTKRAKESINNYARTKRESEMHNLWQQKYA